MEEIAKDLTSAPVSTQFLDQIGTTWWRQLYDNAFKLRTGTDFIWSAPEQANHGSDTIQAMLWMLDHLSPL